MLRATQNTFQKTSNLLFLLFRLNKNIFILYIIYFLLFTILKIQYIKKDLYQYLRHRRIIWVAVDHELTNQAHHQVQKATKQSHKNVNQDFMRFQSQIFKKFSSKLQETDKLPFLNLDKHLKPILMDRISLATKITPPRLC